MEVVVAGVIEHVYSALEAAAVECSGGYVLRVVE